MLRNLVKDSAIYGGADFATKALAFFAFPIIAAALSPLAYGAMELIMTTTALLGLAMNCGLNNSVQRYYWDKDTEESERPTVVSSGLVTLVIFGILAVIFGCAMVPLLLPYVRRAELPMSSVALISALVLMVLSQWLQYMLDVTRLHFSPWRFLSLSLITRILGLGLGVAVVVWLRWGVDGLLAVQALAALATLPLSLWLVRKDLTLNVRLTWVKQLTHFGYPFIFSGMAYWLFGSMDRWMLASMTSVEEVGIYSIAFRFASIVMFVSVAFGQAWSPHAIKIRTDSPETYREVYARVLLLLLFVMLIVGGGVALFSGELIGIIMTDEYGASAIPLAVLCFGIILQSTQQITAIGISLEKKTFLFARLAWFTALINLILNAILIPGFGDQGAAWATTASYMVLTGSYMFYTQRLHPLPIQWGKLLLMAIIGGCLLFISVVKNTVVISWEVVALKLFVGIICVVLLVRVLPLRSFGFGK